MISIKKASSIHKTVEFIKQSPQLLDRCLVKEGVRREYQPGPGTVKTLVIAFCYLKRGIKRHKPMR